MGVPAEKAVRLYVIIFFSDKNLKKGFSLQSLTHLTIQQYNCVTHLKNY